MCTLLTLLLLLVLHLGTVTPEAKKSISIIDCPDLWAAIFFQAGGLDVMKRSTSAIEFVMGTFCCSTIPDQDPLPKNGMHCAVLIITDQAVKNMAVSAKEKASNATTKVEEKMNKGKASANEKADKALATDEVGKHEAEAQKHERKHEAQAEKDQKKLEHEEEKHDLKHDINTRQMAADAAYRNADTGVRDSHGLN